MTMPQAMNNYYGGQKTMAFLLSVLSTALVMLAWITFKQKEQGVHSFGGTVLCIAGLFMLPANLFYFFYVGPQHLGYVAQLKRDPNAFRVAELLHLHRMFSTFLINISLFASFAIAGMLVTLIGFTLDKEPWKGVGAGIALCALILLSVEIWSRDHALIYKRALKIEDSSTAETRPTIPDRSNILRYSPRRPAWPVNFILQTLTRIKYRE